MINNGFRITDNLLSDKEFNFINESLKNKKINFTEKDNYKFANYVISDKDQINRNCYSLFQNIYNLIKKDIETFYECELYDEPFCNIVEYNIGEFVVSHLDTQPQYDSSGNIVSQMPTPNGKPVRHFSTVFYINDDYEGGEICFPNFDFILKPSAGSSLTWPSGQPYDHYTKPIISGKKWMTPVFWHIASF